MAGIISHATIFLLINSPGNWLWFNNSGQKLSHNFSLHLHLRWVQLFWINFQQLEVILYFLEQIWRSATICIVKNSESPDIKREKQEICASADFLKKSKSQKRGLNSHLFLPLHCGCCLPIEVWIWIRRINLFPFVVKKFLQRLCRWNWERGRSWNLRAVEV